MCRQGQVLCKALCTYTRVCLHVCVVQVRPGTMQAADRLIEWAGRSRLQLDVDLWAARRQTGRQRAAWPQVTQDGTGRADGGRGAADREAGRETRGPVGGGGVLAAGARLEGGKKGCLASHRSCYWWRWEAEEEAVMWRGRGREQECGGPRGAALHCHHAAVGACVTVYR